MSETRKKTLKEVNMPNENGVNEFTMEELESLFNSDYEQATPPVSTENQDEQTTSNDKEDVSQTKAFAKRLKESTEKAVNEERERMAKELGFSSYADLQKERESKLYEDKGLDREQVAPIVEEIIKQRLDNDPRMKDLEKYREEQVKEFGKLQLAEITKLTDGEITRFDQIPKDVIELWTKKGDLKSAFLQLKGEELIIKARSSQSKGSTSHMQNPTGTAPITGNKRGLTDEEKAIWKYFNPSMSEEELSKKFIEEK